MSNLVGNRAALPSMEAPHPPSPNQPSHVVPSCFVSLEIIGRGGGGDGREARGAEVGRLKKHTITHMVLNMKSIYYKLYSSHLLFMMCYSDMNKCICYKFTTYGKKTKAYSLLSAHILYNVNKQ